MNNETKELLEKVPDTIIEADISFDDFNLIINNKFVIHDISGSYNYKNELINIKFEYNFNDFQEYDLTKVINNFGIISHPPYNFVIDNKTFTLTHYLYGNYKNSDYVIYGHTHKPKIQKINNCIYINPGECCARRYGRSTIALLDTQAEKTQIIDITD